MAKIQFGVWLGVGIHLINPETLKFFDFWPVELLLVSVTVNVDQPQLTLRRVIDGYLPVEHSEEAE